MADELEIGFCGENWWNSSKTVFGSWPYSSVVKDMRSFEWESDEFGNLGFDGSMVFKDVQKSHLSSSTSTDWNQVLLGGSERDENMLQEDLDYTQIQALLDAEFEPQQSLFDNKSTSYQFTPNNYMKNLNNFLPSLPKFSSLPKVSLPKQRPSSHIHLSNNTSLWNNSVGAVNDIRQNNGDFGDSGLVVKKDSSEPEFKRLRIETPSSMPTFKVRKEKLGDRITALQQLVSPFGKTDTASVLHEAVEYIKLLHGQVNFLSNPYMKNGGQMQRQQNTTDNLDKKDGSKQELRSRGLCLMPISSTFPVTIESTSDFWTPTFGGAYR